MIPNIDLFVTSITMSAVTEVIDGHVTIIYDIIREQ